ncbi:hypothetical protein [Amycolatopsis minnesotensis]|uniref:Uncharacterized protein n=1 Tax=Amycolatopsis minnesotensis TaxID=337894 RepID=A0ABN2PXV4_9PSEU
MRRVAELVGLAMDVPARGVERRDWQARGLAELLLQSLVTDDDQLANSAIRATRAIHSATWRFTERLDALRTLAETAFDLPTLRGPTPGPDRPRAQVASPTVRAAAVRLARILDGRSVGASVAARESRVVTTATALRTELNRVSPVRPAAVADHTCVNLWVPPGLTWSGWFATDDGPVFTATPRLVGRPQLAVWFGLHVGTHLDLLSRSPNPAGLQFGRGLLIAEGLATALEIIRFAASAESDEVSVLQAGLIERLARLPGIATWGPVAMPESESMAEAVALSNPEFSTLPTLAGAYVAGPFVLAGRRFRCRTVPDQLAEELFELWRSVGFVGY